MRTQLFSMLLTLLLISTPFLPITFAQYQSYMQLSLPEGAKARLGKGKIHEIQYAPDGTRLAVAGSIGIWLYDAQTNEELDLLGGYMCSVRSLSFSPDGRTLASGGSDGTLRFWDANTGNLLHTITGQTTSVHSVAFSPDGQTLASGGGDGTVLLWDLAPAPPKR